MLCNQHVHCFALSHLVAGADLGSTMLNDIVEKS